MNKLSFMYENKFKFMFKLKLRFYVLSMYVKKNFTLEYGVSLKYMNQ